MQFGDVIATERKRQGLSQKALASRVTNKEGVAISPQYLNDLERGRRNPPSDVIITNIALALALEPEYLFYLAGHLPPDLRDARSRAQVNRAFLAFRTALDAPTS